jgi:hypothetical protein
LIAETSRRWPGSAYSPDAAAISRKMETARSSRVQYGLMHPEE